MSVKIVVIISMKIFFDSRFLMIDFVTIDLLRQLFIVDEQLSPCVQLNGDVLSIEKLCDVSVRSPLSLLEQCAS